MCKFQFSMILYSSWNLLTAKESWAKHIISRRVLSYSSIELTTGKIGDIAGDDGHGQNVNIRKAGWIQRGCRYIGQSSPAVVLGLIYPKLSNRGRI